MISKRILTLVVLFITFGSLFSQNLINGTVYDKKSKETLVGANVIIPEIGKGTMTDIDGLFQIDSYKLPIEIEVSFIGFEKKIIIVESSSPIKVYLSEDKQLLSEIIIVDSRLTDKQKQSPITVEAMDVIAIKETPAASFYEGLGALKGVDVTSASMGFKIINTRGFNSTSPVRSLQIIDGVDNQSPGLNFSLGNFLGSSELDLKKVEIVVGANSSLYGPNAFNGVISMETKDPFQFPGFSAQVKGGARNLNEIAIRWAQSIKNKNGEDKFGYKLNYYRMTASDWVANNYDQAFDSPTEPSNPGGYDAVNRYGDEEYSSFSNFALAPGLGSFHRPGYREEDLVDYDTENTKMNAAFFFKPTAKTELIYATNYGNGTTVYQGDNRYSLKDLEFFQNRIEFRQKDKFFIRLYETHEDAGNSYDAVATAISLQNMQMSKKKFSEEYSGYWTQSIIPQILEIPGWIDVLDIPFFETDPVTGETILDENGIPVGIPNAYQNWYTDMNEILDNNPEIFQEFHEETQDYMDSYVGQFGNSFLVPGSPEFQEAFDEITSQTRYDNQGNLVGGTMFYDRSRLYHAHAEYKFDLGLNKFVVGANARMYAPNSNGSIFDDGYIQSYKNIYSLDDQGNQIVNYDTTLVNVSTNPFVPVFEEIIDSSYVFTIDTIVNTIDITNKEYGVYMGYNRDFLSNTLKLAGSIRMDKNQNFDYLISPAASIVYTPSEKDVIRVSLSSAIRNPTLTDQYLNYNAGQGILLGNLNGFGFEQYFANLDSLEQYFIGEYVNPDALLGGLLQISPISPEKVKTIEIGYRTTILNKLYVDASAYFSSYTDFIGYQSGASFKFGSTMVSDSTDIINGWATAVGDTIDNYRDLSYSSIQPYRLAANASEGVTTQGFTIGLNYFLSQSITLNANYSFNKLNKAGTDDPIIPAYNTPEHKYNIGITGRDLNLMPNSRNWGFSVNYKWVEGFLFEGSPQFTGLVPTYTQLDAQINKSFPSIYSTLKLGASNLLNNFTYQVYGGPRVGRMVYLSLQIDIN
ncbi:MAG: TonB-dependent receptor [Flavobacteriales bacterium]|nr:TonB-dependent receptor [Flavobacteriales bacterium]